MRAETFRGYRRPDGRVGVRNHVVILPVDDISNAAAEAVARVIHGVLPLPHAYGRLQFGEDLELFFRTMIGTGANPNVAACVVIGIEPNWTRRIAEGIARTGKPVEAFWIEGYGDLRTVERAGRAAQRLLQQASELVREPCQVRELYVSAKCGESDTTTGLASCPAVGEVFDHLDSLGATMSFGETSELTGAEDICAARAATCEVAEEFRRVFRACNDFILAQGADLLGSQPTEGNIRGGLTTIEEKALGNLQKIGRRCRFVGCLRPAESPRGPGLWFMDTSSAAAEAVTLWAASGAVVHLFPTGQGNTIGNPIVPVIKITGNPSTARSMGEHIDVDVSGLLQREYTLEEAGDRVWEMMIRVCDGRLTCAETLGHREFVLTRLYRSA
jgi:(2R)-sulfolactate sulfo-lyase subunit beta